MVPEVCGCLFALVLIFLVEIDFDDWLVCAFMLLGFVIVAYDLIWCGVLDVTFGVICFSGFGWCELGRCGVVLL